jgi:hypothetical protein
MSKLSPINSMMN